MTVTLLILGLLGGFLSGLLGLGGAVVLIPLMLTVLRVPLKAAVGTSLGIVFIGALTGSAGKLLSLQVNAALAIPLILGSVPAAQLGAKCSKALKSETLRCILLAVVFVSLIKIGLDVFAGAE
ncbi:MAG: sulfite exporter TauE/SafE family protein [Kiritimatiellales bacterium]|jgi:hypothetical protein